MDSVGGDSVRDDVEVCCGLEIVVPQWIAIVNTPFQGGSLGGIYIHGESRRVAAGSHSLAGRQPARTRWLATAGSHLSASNIPLLIC